MKSSQDTTELHQKLERDGFAFVVSDTMRKLLDGPESLVDWKAFVASWNDLATDTYLAATGRQRRRRHAIYQIDADGVVQRTRQQPHYQSLQNNPLQGNMQRWFMPIRPVLADGPSMRCILGFCRKFFGELAPNVDNWHVEAHQFRIEASADKAGEPTPEGIHRDGVDYVLVLLIDRLNIERGTTTTHSHDGALLGSFTLTHALDAALVDDNHVLHGVTAVIPLDPAQPAHRDVLVVTFRHTEPGAA